LPLPKREPVQQPLPTPYSNPVNVKKEEEEEEWGDFYDEKESEDEDYEDCYGYDDGGDAYDDCNACDDHDAYDDCDAYVTMPMCGRSWSKKKPSRQTSSRVPECGGEVSSMLADRHCRGGPHGLE
jgi:hypothetical protein